MTLRLVLCCVALYSLRCGYAEASNSLTASPHAQPHFVRIGDHQSIPMGTVTRIVEDSSGFLWVGTQEGLSRFDGHEFRVFRKDREDPQSLIGNHITALAPAENGIVWIGTVGDGLAMYNPVDEGFHRVAGNQELADGAVMALAISDNNLWVGTHDGLIRLDRSNHDASAMAMAGTLSSRVMALFVDRSGQLWVGTQKGLGRLDGDIVRAVQDTLELQIRAINQGLDGRIWLGTRRRGAHIHDPSSGSVTALDQAGGAALSYVTSITPAGAAEMWLGGFGAGISVRDRATGARIRTVTSDPSNPLTIPSNHIGAMLRSDGVIWAGTWGAGLARHRADNLAFQRLRRSEGLPDGLPEVGYARAVQLTDRSIVALPRTGLTLHRFRLDEPGVGRLTFPAISNRVRVTTLAAGPSSDHPELWIGTDRSTVSSWTLDRSAPTHYPLPPEAGADAIINTMIVEEKAVTVASSAGVFRLDRATGAWTNIGAPQIAAAETLAADAARGLWVGSSDGLFLVDHAHSHVTRFDRDDQAEAALSDKVILSLLVDRSGTLWVGTRSGIDRLVGLQDGKARFENIGPKIGRDLLPNENLLQDRNGRIWIESNTSFDPESFQVTSFGDADGADVVIWTRASTRLNDGRFLFAGPSGLLLVDPLSATSSQPPPPPMLTDVWVGDTRRPGAAAMHGIAVPPAARGFSVTMSALSLNHGDRLRYRYRLEGFDSQWQTLPPGQRTAIYTALPPGSYALHMTASIGGIPGADRIVPILVLPAWFQTWWARLALSVTTLIALIMLYRWRLHSLLARRSELESLVAERTSDLHQANSRLQHLATTDELTQLSNRRAGSRALKQLVERAAAGGDLISVAIMDVDHFKRINDDYGHDVGDRVLAEIAGRLREATRPGDRLCRWGGEEFLVILQECDARCARRAMERLRQAVASRMFSGPGEVTISVGLASLVEGDSVGQLIRRADQALYESKAAGRNRITLAS